MKVIINPEYRRFEEFVNRVPSIFPKEGKTIYKSRNEIKVFTVDGIEINVKRYKVPIFINRIIYSFLRKPKAVRAYEFAQVLKGKGFDTPDPIAYILFEKDGLLEDSYFISIQSDYQTLYKVGQAPAEDNADIYTALGTYMAALHEAGIYHADFSPGNVLYARTEEGVKFSLIDINRMDFGAVLLKKGCANFARIWGREAAFRMMAKTYAEARRYNEATCLHWILYYRNRFWKRYAKKRAIEFEL